VADNNRSSATLGNSDAQYFNECRPNSVGQFFIQLIRVNAAHVVGLNNGAQITLTK
jgi:hypothetical protein